MAQWVLPLFLLSLELKNCNKVSNSDIAKKKVNQNKMPENANKSKNGNNYVSIQTRATPLRIPMFVPMRHISHADCDSGKGARAGHAYLCLNAWVTCRLHPGTLSYTKHWTWSSFMFVMTSQWTDKEETLNVLKSCALWLKQTLSWWKVM